MLSCDKTKKTYTIGILTNLEGANSELTVTAYNAIKLAYKDFTVKNKDIEIKFKALDESFDPEKIIESYELLKKSKCGVIMVMTTFPWA